MGLWVRTAVIPGSVVACAYRPQLDRLVDDHNDNNLNGRTDHNHRNDHTRNDHHNDHNRLASNNKYTIDRGADHNDGNKHDSERGQSAVPDAGEVGHHADTAGKVRHGANTAVDATHPGGCDQQSAQQYFRASLEEDCPGSGRHLFLYSLRLV
jgi:hypothetical protein